MGKASISCCVQSAQLKEIRRGDPDGQGRHSYRAFSADSPAPARRLRYQPLIRLGRDRF